MAANFDQVAFIEKQSVLN